MIREARAADIDQAVAQWLAEGHGALFVTLTIRHHAGVQQRSLVNAVVDGWRDVQKHAPYKRLREAHGIEGQIKALELTYGEHGVHPHLHMVLFVCRNHTRSQVRALQRSLTELWGAEVARRGLGTIHDVHGVDVRTIRSRNDPMLGSYLTKVRGGWGTGQELARGDVKSKGRTAWDVLERFLETGDVDELATWHGYEDATKGRNAVTWSRGLKRRLLLANTTDEQLATVAPVDVIGSVTIARKTWNELVRSCEYVLVLEGLEAIAHFANNGRPPPCNNDL